MSTGGDSEYWSEIQGAKLLWWERWCVSFREGIPFSPLHLNRPHAWVSGGISASNLDFQVMFCWFYHGKSPFCHHNLGQIQVFKKIFVEFGGFSWKIQVRPYLELTLGPPWNPLCFRPLENLTVFTYPPSIWDKFCRSFSKHHTKQIQTSFLPETNPVSLPALMDVKCWGYDVACWLDPFGMEASRVCGFVSRNSHSVPGLPPLENLTAGTWKYTQQEKEKHLQTTNFWGSMLVLGGVSFTQVCILVGNMKFKLWFHGPVGWLRVVWWDFCRQTWTCGSSDFCCIDSIPW